MTEREVMLRLATYNLLSVAIVDAGNHLLGAITVDDVLDRALPGDWRRTQLSPSIAHHPTSRAHAQPVTGSTS